MKLPARFSDHVSDSFAKQGPYLLGYMTLIMYINLHGLCKCQKIVLTEPFRTDTTVFYI